MIGLENPMKKYWCYCFIVKETEENWNAVIGFALFPSYNNFDTILNSSQIPLFSVASFTYPLLFFCSLCLVCKFLYFPSTSPSPHFSCSTVLSKVFCLMRSISSGPKSVRVEGHPPLTDRCFCKCQFGSAGSWLPDGSSRALLETVILETVIPHCPMVYESWSRWFCLCSCIKN